MVKHVDKVTEPKRADKHEDIISEKNFQDKENHQKENDASKSYESDKSMTLYSPDKYMENIQAHFTTALEKICTQQSKLFDAKLKAVEETYTKLLENNNKNFSQLLLTVTKSLKTQPETDKFNGLISSLEKENITLKSAVKELRNESLLSAECWKSKMETQKSQIEQQKQTYEKSFKDLQIAIDTLQIQIQGKDDEITNIKMSLDDTTKTVEQKENEILSLKLTMSQDNTNEFQEVRSKHKNNTKNDKRVLIIGTSNTQGIDPTKLSSKFLTGKIKAYTLDKTEEAIQTIDDIPDVLVLHSLTNDLTTKPKEECVNKMDKIIEDTHKRHPDLKIIISLPTPRADDESLNIKAQMLSIMLKEKFNNKDNVTLL
ncbi:unnamed protein product [Mytilus coruscus]|uniref:Uncharacterized protein n=1 Tax=Mytilus coruscus TaxID=42192 RepID=A0A6J8AEJ2_MYTCO|nr:unnamed protein product [Mytilus coruscus]